MPTEPENLVEAIQSDDSLALANLLLPIQPDNHVQGPAEARFTLVEYGDYQCPACGALFQTIQQVHEQLKEDVRLVFRHYPLSGSHPQAQQAAEAAEAAGAQERFWEMHEILFQNQNALTNQDLQKYARQLELDMERFDAETKDHKYEERVREDFRRGVANGVYGTPGLFINGIRFNGDPTFDAIRAAMNGP
jgi:protein-disulfide isomerase